MIISPLVAARIGVYGAPNDAWGKPEQRTDHSPLMPEDMFNYASTEICVKWQIGVDSVYAFGSSYGKETFFEWMKKYGITELGGKPVEEMVGHKHAAAHRKAEFAKIKKSLESGGWI